MSVPFVEGERVRIEPEVISHGARWLIFLLDIERRVAGEQGRGAEIFIVQVIAQKGWPDGDTIGSRFVSPQFL